MELEHLPSDDSLIRIALHGMLDLSGVSRIETAFLAATVALGRNSVVDLSQVTFVSSLGLAMLIGASKSLKRKGAKLVLLAPTRDVFKIFAVSGLLDVLMVTQNEAGVTHLLEQPVAAF